jgi:hypothetical protein
MLLSIWLSLRPDAAPKEMLCDLFSKEKAFNPTGIEAPRTKKLMKEAKRQRRALP